MGRIARSLAAALAAAATLAGAVQAAPHRDLPPDPFLADALAPHGWFTRAGIRLADLVPSGQRGAGKGITVILIDTGIDFSNADFATGIGSFVDRGGRCRANGRFEGLPANRAANWDPLGHGTTVASVAVAPVNGVGAVGAAPQATLVPIRIDGRGGDYGPALACALRRAAHEIDATGGLAVVNISLTLGQTAGDLAWIARPLDALVRRHALVVAAAGNRGGGRRAGDVLYPARLPHVLSVGVLGRVQSYDGGAHLDVLAPGEGMPLAVPGGYGMPAEAATSWATGLVSGLAANAWSRVDGTAQQLAWRLRASGGPIGRWSPARGFGGVSLARALKLRVPRDDELEPNDARAAAVAAGSLLSCNPGCGTVGGIAGTTDDPVDWWVVGLPAGARPCPVVYANPRRGVALTSAVALGGGRWALELEARAPLVRYLLRLRPGRC